VPMRPGRTLSDLVAAGELAAAVGVKPSPPGLVPLLPDAAEAGFAALRRRGHYPINHLVVVRDDLLAAHPGLATDVFQAFVEAKNLYVDRLRRDAIEAPTPTDVMYRHVMEITGADPLPYGIAPNRAVIEELIAHATRQRILDRAPSVESLFAESTRDLTG
jgi:4,5-dihydroxyphthalate decarboxylase